MVVSSGDGYVMNGERIVRTRSSGKWSVLKLARSVVTAASAVFINLAHRACCFGALSRFWQSPAKRTQRVGD